MSYFNYTINKIKKKNFYLLDFQIEKLTKNGHLKFYAQKKIEKNKEK